MQKNKESDKQTSSTSSTFAGKAEKGDISGRVGESRVPSKGGTTGATFDHDKVGPEEASNAGGQWDKNKKSPKAA
jgi:hypothetical protein